MDYVCLHQYVKPKRVSIMQCSAFAIGVVIMLSSDSHTRLKRFTRLLLPY